MDEPKVYFVHLRRPWNADDVRSDPFWEFGSFGCTGCHSTNLLNLRHADELDGARLAFVQGGPLGHRLVFLTPPVNVQRWIDRCELRWTPAEMPFRYASAPILVVNGGRGHFPAIARFARQGNRLTIEGAFSSRIRSLARPLPRRLAEEVTRVYEKRRAAANDADLAVTYDDALPRPPRVPDRRRRETYRQKINKLELKLEIVKAKTGRSQPVLRNRKSCHPKAGQSRQKKGC